MHSVHPHRHVWSILGIVLVSLVLLAACSPASAQPDPPAIGNVVFIHPDGTGLSHWNAARMYWKGPDGQLAWDHLPDMALYRGHLINSLTASSHGGATTHAFGYKVATNSFGEDNGRSILARSGYPGSIMREAANRGYPVGVVNDGHAAEPGTAVFLAEVDSRGNTTEIVRQILDGRPQADDVPPVVVLGGGERYFLPNGTPTCGATITPGCAVYGSASRGDGRNLVQEATAAGWVVLRTRQEFDAFKAQLAADASYAPHVLGLFAAGQTFNARPEEQLIADGFIDTSVPADDKRGRLVIWGQPPGEPGDNPPTAAEMTDVALTILQRRSQQAERPFLLVAEVESTDNLGNVNNAIGMLRATRRADDVIDVARAFQANDPDTLLITAADSDAGGLQVIARGSGNVGSSNNNPTGESAENVAAPQDGREGRGTAAFLAEPDAFGRVHAFGILWSGTPDVAGAIVSRAQGLHADRLRTEFANQFDNTDIYRMMYGTLFGEWLPTAEGQTAPDRVFLQTDPLTVTQQVGTPITLTVSLQDAARQPLPDTALQITISGTHRLDDTLMTDVDGTATATYTGTQAGNDTITIWLDANSNQVPDAFEPVVQPTVEWLAAAVEVEALTRSGGSPTSAATITYTLRFDGPVRGLSASNMDLTTDGTLSGVHIIDISTSNDGVTSTITVDTGTGTGTIYLALAHATGLSAPISGLPVSAPATEVEPGPARAYTVFLALVVR
jgi:alkaline phosphatase